jgi:Ca-activated chloride channel homolog
MKGVAIVTWVLAVGALAAQQRPTFRSGIHTVEMYATARADDGRLVTDLNREDFEIRDNGQPRDLTVFSREIVSITVAVMLDMSGSQEGGVNWFRDAAHAFVDELRAGDRARIGSFGFEIAIGPRLTGDRNYLHQVLNEEIWPGGPTPLWPAVDAAMTSLASEPGRRVVLALTDGLDTSDPSLLDTLETRTAREGFMVYGIGHAEKRAGKDVSAGAAVLSGEMRNLATDSGGGYRLFGSAQGAKEAMAQIAEELHHQYLIGFTPAVLDGKIHKLELKAKRDGMSAHTRGNYLAVAR